MNDLISVIIPVWNGSAYLAEAAESIMRENIRTEIVVVDDGSRDASREIAGELGCKVVSIPHSGIAAACNTGLKKCSGNFVLFLDQDDVMLAGSLQRLYSALTSDSSLLAAAAMARDFISPELSNRERKGLIPRKNPYYGLLTGSMLLHREVFDIVGDFNESYHAGQAVDYLFRIAACKIKVARLDFVSVNRRLHKKNTGITMKDKQFNDYGIILRGRLKTVMKRDVQNG